MESGIHRVEQRIFLAGVLGNIAFAYRPDYRAGETIAVGVDALRGDGDRIFILDEVAVARPERVRRAQV